MGVLIDDGGGKGGSQPFGHRFRCGCLGGCPKLGHGFIGKEEADHIPLFQLFIALGFFAVEHDIFLSEHFVKKALGRPAHVAGEKFIKPLSGIPGSYV